MNQTLLIISSKQTRDIITVYLNLYQLSFRVALTAASSFLTFLIGMGRSQMLIQFVPSTE